MKMKSMYLLIMFVLLLLNCSDVPDYDSADRVLPSGTISINSGDIYSQSGDVALDIDVINAEEMCFSTDDITYTVWEPYNSGRNITLPSGHGIKTVYAKFRNSNGETTVTDSVNSLIESKITAAVGTANANFGGGNWGHTTANLVLSHDGNTLITSSAVSNRVYIYRNNSGIWTETILTEPASGALYGQSIACTPEAELLVVGALNGACINIYRQSGSGYSLEHRITSPTPTITNDYSVTVSISDDGNRILVGSWRYNGGVGRAYLYQKTGSSWTDYSEYIFESPTGLATDNFGLGVKISGDGNTIAISAPNSNTRRGSLYIYRRNGSAWSGTEYTASDGAAQDTFARHIGMSTDGSRIVAGSRCWGQGDPLRQCAAYLFEWNGSVYVETKKFAGLGSDPDTKFGYSVAMSSDGNIIVIGEPFKSGASVKGRAYVFTWNNSEWKNEAVISASEGAANEFYGNVAAVSGDGSVIAVSASLDTIGSNAQQGSVYLYY